jgi:hypothetical protein
MSDISKDVSLFFFGNKYGNFASSGSGALFMRPRIVLIHHCQDIDATDVLNDV